MTNLNAKKKININDLNPDEFFEDESKVQTQVAQTTNDENEKTVNEKELNP